MSRVVRKGGRKKHEPPVTELDWVYKTPDHGKTKKEVRDLLEKARFVFQEKYLTQLVANPKDTIDEDAIRKIMTEENEDYAILAKENNFGQTFAALCSSKWTRDQQIEMLYVFELHSMLENNLMTEDEMRTLHLLHQQGIINIREMDLIDAVNYAKEQHKRSVEELIRKNPKAAKLLLPTISKPIPAASAQVPSAAAAEPPAVPDAAASE